MARSPRTAKPYPRNSVITGMVRLGRSGRVPYINRPVNDRVLRSHLPPVSMDATNKVIDSLFDDIRMLQYAYDAHAQRDMVDVYTGRPVSRVIRKDLRSLGLLPSSDAPFSLRVTDDTNMFYITRLAVTRFMHMLSAMR
ncbi:MAG: hypothetical protein MPK62_01460 [Alphaproteobacteria bacterium]|nr:hypothetical protein [Alphaproteobacteria bacterium]MDA8029802.1 hypothetical protein [Alphaproteobacteria bacterium]